MKITLHIFALLIIIASVPTSVSAQSPVRTLENYFAELRHNSSAPMPYGVLSDRRDDDQVLTILARFSSDSLA